MTPLKHQIVALDGIRQYPVTNAHQAAGRDFAVTALHRAGETNQAINLDDPDTPENEQAAEALLNQLAEEFAAHPDAAQAVTPLALTLDLLLRVIQELHAQLDEYEAKA